MTKKLSTEETKIELRNRGILVISGDIEFETMGTAAENLFYMEACGKGHFNKIQIILNSWGGELDAGFFLSDVIEHISLPVYITGLGSCASAGLNILVSGTKGHRIITKNTSLLCHQYAWRSDGKHHELVAIRKEHDLTYERMVNHYMKHTEMTKKQVKEILLPSTDTWLTPAEARKYGLVDKVVGK